MKICGVCNAKFPVRIVIDGIRRNLSGRKYCLSCSPFKEHNTVKLSTPKSEITLYCHGCDKLLRGNQRKYCSFACRAKILQSNVALQVKKEWVQKLGGCCRNCGYRKNLSALSFHHIDPTTKKFNLSAQMLVRNREMVEEEILKCELLCMNCHFALHNPDGDID